jgi:hypothetical protein
MTLIIVTETGFEVHPLLFASSLLRLSFVSASENAERVAKQGRTGHKEAV